MTKQQLLQAVYARLGGKPDFAPEPLIIAKAREAIKMVTKEIVYSGNPLSHLLIGRSEELDLSSGDELEFFEEDLNSIDLDLVKISPKFNSVIWTGRWDGNEETMESCNSWDALETLPKLHNKPYYKWHNNKIYVSLPDVPLSGEDEINEGEVNVCSLIIEHYAYLPLEDFPYELIDVLLNALIPMIVPAPPEPPKNNGKSKQK